MISCNGVLTSNFHANVFSQSIQFRTMSCAHQFAAPERLKEWRTIERSRCNCAVNSEWTKLYFKQHHVRLVAVATIKEIMLI